jgi:hypothetical protein
MYFFLIKNIAIGMYNKLFNQELKKFPEGKIGLKLNNIVINNNKSVFVFVLYKYFSIIFFIKR